MAPPEWTPPAWQASAAPSLAHPGAPPRDLIERAAGTGLTGRSDQRFEPAFVGALELETTVIKLRLVIGTEEAFNTPRPLPESERVPAPERPAARP